MILTVDHVTEKNSFNNLYICLQPTVELLATLCLPSAPKTAPVLHDVENISIEFKLFVTLCARVGSMYCDRPQCIIGELHDYSILRVKEFISN